MTSSPAIDHTCGGCRKVSDKFLSCAECKLMRYCSKECQRRDWPHHRPNCKVAAASPNPGIAKRMSESISAELHEAWSSVLRANPDSVLIVQYTGPADVPFDIAKAMTGDVRDARLVPRLVPVAEAKDIIVGKDWAHTDSGKAWYAGKLRVALLSSAEGTTETSCISVLLT